MGTDASTVRTHEAARPDWEVVKRWAGSTFTKERMVEVGLGAATVTVMGLVLFSLHRAMESYVIMGF